jgi:hypothetical protein
VWRDVLSDAGAVGSFGRNTHDIVVIKWTTGARRDKETYLTGFA